MYAPFMIDPLYDLFEICSTPARAELEPFFPPPGQFARQAL